MELTEEYINFLNDLKNRNIISINGKVGTGKTLLSLDIGYWLSINYTKENIYYIDFEDYDDIFKEKYQNFKYQYLPFNKFTNYNIQNIQNSLFIFNGCTNEGIRIIEKLKFNNNQLVINLFGYGGSILHYFDLNITTNSYNDEIFNFSITKDRLGIYHNKSIKSKSIKYKMLSIIRKKKIDSIFN